jgi:DNA invertase Pin-like site-specific DNA recombinase
MKYGYARVSTGGQSVAAQTEALTAAEAEKVFQGNGQRREDRPGAAAPAP